MMKYTLSGIVLLLLQLEANRLLQTITCANVDCRDNCYDLLTGPVCCDPAVCVTGKCGGNGLVECDKDSECIADSSCPQGMFDCPGICINPNAVSAVGCGVDNCNSYFDGCNTCKCGDNGVAGCTRMFCPPEATSEPYCTGCEDGYTINKLTNKCLPTLTCANVLCVQGTLCYETPTGPGCCDPAICQKGICNGIGGLQCDAGYECVDDPINPCDPTTTSDCAGVCVDIDAKPEQSVGCGIDNCNSYFDGCNSCTCGDNGVAGCTLKFCPPESTEEPYCTGCEDGYAINKLTNKCEPEPVGCGIDNCNSYFDGCNGCSCGDTGFAMCTLRFCGPDEMEEAYCTGCQDGYIINKLTNKCEPEPVVGCGVDNCNSYFDGCNTCSCGDNGIAGCTRMFCPPESTKEPYCTGCEKGYILNPSTKKCETCFCTLQYDPVCCDEGQFGNACQAGCQQATNCQPGPCPPSKVTCARNRDCDTENGYKCRNDPLCRNRNRKCEQTDVCLIRGGKCVSDVECESGYQCVGLNKRGVGDCVDYE